MTRQTMQFLQACMPTLHISLKTEHNRRIWFCKKKDIAVLTYVDTIKKKQSFAYLSSLTDRFWSTVIDFNQF